MFQNLIGNIVWGVIRHSLTTIGGGLVADGVLTNDQNSQLVGALITALGIAWSGWQKWKQHKNAVAIATPTPVGDDLTGATVKTIPVEIRPLAPIQ